MFTYIDYFNLWLIAGNSEDVGGFVAHNADDKAREIAMNTHDIYYWIIMGPLIYYSLLNILRIRQCTLSTK